MRNIITQFKQKRNQHIASHWEAPKQATPEEWISAQEKIAEELLKKTTAYYPHSRVYDPLWKQKVENSTADDYNCLTYTLDYLGHGWLNPGDLAKRFREDEKVTIIRQEGKPLNPERVRVLLERDELTELAELPLETLQERGWVMAFYVSEKRNDFHVRLIDADGGISEVRGWHHFHLATDDNDLKKIKNTF